MRRATSVLAGLVGVLAPALAAACPVCGANDRPGLGLLALVGGMIGVPYLVAAIAIKVIRRADRDSLVEAPAPSAPHEPS